MPAIQTSYGAEIHYQVYGDGPVNLIFLHGWGGSHETWREVIKHLDLGRFRAIVPDLRGHGQSSLGTSACSWEIFTKDILAIADFERAHVFIPIGFSLGGKLACLLSTKFPRRIPAQVLVAPVAPAEVPIDRNLGLQICREANDWQRGKHYFRGWFAPTAPEELVDACCQRIASIPQSVLETTAEMILWTSLAFQIKKRDLPTLVVSGELDPVYGAAYLGEQMLPFLNQPETATVTSSGHFIPLEHPIELAGLIEKFVIKSNTNKQVKD
jgi:non-heme chloroperoxidase